MKEITKLIKRLEGLRKEGCDVIHMDEEQGFNHSLILKMRINHVAIPDKELKC